MKAVLFDKYGLPEVLQLVDVDKPHHKEDEILVKVHAATVTAGDCEMRRFDLPWLWWIPIRLFMGVFKPRNKILGQELSGEVEAVGEKVSRFKRGDQIYSASGPTFGAYAQYKCFKSNYAIARKPVNMSYEEAATVPTGGLNALYFLRKANIKPGDKILIIGAGGSIGTYGVQLAKYFKAEVTAVDSFNKLGMLKSLGADYVIDYQKEDFRKNGKTYDVIFDIVGKGWLAQGLKSLNAEGRYLIANPGIRTLTLALITRLFGNKKVMNGLAPYKIEDLEFLTDLIEKQHLKSVIDKRYPLSALAEAHRYVETGEKKGNVVITIAH